MAHPENFCANHKYSCLTIHVSPLSRKDSTAANPRQSSTNCPCPENTFVSQRHPWPKGSDIGYEFASPHHQRPKRLRHRKVPSTWGPSNRKTNGGKPKTEWLRFSPAIVARKRACFATPSRGQRGNKVGYEFATQTPPTSKQNVA